MIILVTLVFSVLVIAFLGFIAWKGIQRAAEDGSEEANRRGGPGGVRGGRRPAAGGRVANVRQRRTAAARNNSDDEEEFDEDDEMADMPFDPNDEEGLQYVDDSGKKMGVKKQRKLEMKEERKRAREIELQEREERKKRNEEIEAARKLEEAALAAEEKAKAEEERLEKEKKEREEYEEYLKLKESFAIEEEGCDGDVNEEEGQNRLQVFIEYIKSQKVVHMDELAGHFNMRTADVISRIQELLAQELLVGVIDDRGKFIYITNEELASVAKFIRQRGRVSITELAENSNSFINLAPQLESQS